MGLGLTGLKRYENVLQNILNVEDIYNLNKADWNGCLGLASVLTFMEGTPPYLVHLARKLEIDQEELETSYNRLRINGIFSNSYNVPSDKVLRRKNNKSSRYSTISPKHETQIAWGIIAGISSGYTGLR